jgi:hypothetical protein
MSSDLHERFDELIKFGKTLMPFKSSLEYLAKKGRWEVQCQALLERAFGKNNVYLRKFQAILTYGNQEAHVTSGISLMEGAKEDWDLESKSDKLGKIRRKIQEEKAEAERRAAVAETKQLGSFIEVIDMLREELKRRNQMNQEIMDMHKEIGEIRAILTEMKDNFEKLISKQENKRQSVGVDKKKLKNSKLRQTH